MICSNTGDRQLSTILVVQDSNIPLAADSKILNSFKEVYVSIGQGTGTLLWIQQNQPDLIILNLEGSKIAELDLIAALKLDWLTRHIPILAIVNQSDRFQAANLDCDAYIAKSYSTLELEKAICSLVSNPVCLSYAS